MFDPSEGDDDKLRHLREDFESCIDQQSEAQTEAHRAARFYHNTNCEGQWESGDLEALREEGRVALSFNLIKPKIDTVFGMIRDEERTPKARPVGGEDAFVADVLNNICDRAAEIVGLDTIDGEVLFEAIIRREHSVRVDVAPDPDNPVHSLISVNSIPCYDLHWDTSSNKADRSDARYFFWDKWLSKGEFDRLYPDHDFSQLVKRGDAESNGDTRADRSEEAAYNIDSNSDDMYSGGGDWDRYYYKRHRNQIRVIHAEYKVPERVYFLIDRHQGTSDEVSKEIADRLPELIEAGRLPEGLESTSTVRDKIHTVQWVGPEILYDGDLGQPYDGMSVTTFAYELDSESGTSYGAVRNLFDPQQETNKAHSLSLENLAAQGKPGYIAEENAISDLNQFEEALQTTQGVALVKDGKLTAVIPRQPAQSSSGITERLSNSVNMLDKISNTATDDTSPAGAAEAAATMQLRQRKSQMSKRRVTDAFESYLKRVKKQMLQAIIRSFPDSQLQEYLGNASKYVVQDGTIYELDEQGQPKNQTTLEEVRTLRHDVVLEVSSENTTQRMMNFQALAQLKAAGAEVDDAVLVETATPSRALAERLKNYAEAAQKGKAQAQQAESQRMDQQMQTAFQMEQGKNAETARSNQMDEWLQYEKQTSDHAVKSAAVMERADANERKLIADTMAAIEARQNQRRMGG